MPTALGRLKIQFCQAVSRPKIRVSIVSGPGKRRLASIPVIASGLKLARSSRKMRTSSSQSMSSRIIVTSPASSASAASIGSPMRPCSASTLSGSPRNRVSNRLKPLAIG